MAFFNIQEVLRIDQYVSGLVKGLSILWHTKIICLLRLKVGGFNRESVCGNQKLFENQMFLMLSL